MSLSTALACSSSTGVVICGFQTARTALGSPRRCLERLRHRAEAVERAGDLVAASRPTARPRRRPRSPPRAWRRPSRRRGIDDLADVGEHVRHRAGLAEVAVVLGERRAHRAGGAVAVVGQRLDDDGDAARGRSPRSGSPRSCRLAAQRLLDGALDIVLGHVLGARGLDREPQPRVHARIGRADLGGDRDLAGELGEQLGAGGILPPLRCMMFLNCEWPGIPWGLDRAPTACPRSGLIALN